MNGTIKSAVHAAVLRILEPLVTWLLDAGVGVGDLQPLVKTAYVRAARKRAREAGAEYLRPNASRISIMTGLTRREVGDILERDAVHQTHDRGRQRAERVLTGWWNDSAFQEVSGEPAVLPLKGSKASFTALVERYSGERTQVGTILSELLRVKAVRRLSDGRLRAVSRTYAPVGWEPEGLTAFGEQIAELCSTLLQNLNSPRSPRFVRRVVNSRLDPRYLPMLIRDIQQQAEVFADSIDDTLNDPLHTLTAKTPEGEATSLGLAMYTFESAATEADAASASTVLRETRARRVGSSNRKNRARKRAME
jgi:Family of unknown function (DUF6502)